MPQIIGGHNLGLLDGSYSLLNRNDFTSKSILGHGEQSYINVSNGNFIFQDRDVFLPSLGEDFNFIRTYNSRGVTAGSSNGWSFSTFVTLTAHTDTPSSGKNVTDYTLTEGDGTSYELNFDSKRNLWVSTDGAGAFQTLDVLKKVDPDGALYVVTRADQTQYRFDKNFNLVGIIDTNGVSVTFDYQGGKLTKVHDDNGHVITLNYSGLGNLTSIVDEQNVTLIQYGYTGSLLTSVTDRDGHVTTYHYNNASLLDSITLPDKQLVNGQLQTYAQRTVTFTYQQIQWDDHPHVISQFDKGYAYVLTQIVDANGGITSFDYNFQFGTTAAPSDRDLAFKPNGARDFLGGSTRIVDALGNARAYSNDAEYVAWRTAHGFYATYDATAVAGSAALQAQVVAIRNAQSVVYTYDANGQITGVVDQLGFQTGYVYDGSGNLTSITDANGWGATNSDSAYYRALRADVGYKDVGGNGKLVANLTAAEKTALLAKFTTKFTYDGNGNVLTVTDNAGNVTTYTYTAFNKISTVKTPLGGVTTYLYDAKQNLTKRTDSLGRAVSYQYDATGNLTSQTVFLDPSDLTKKQVTQYFYDAFGNNVKIIDAEGNMTTKAFDHLGNLVSSVDGRGNVSTFVYDGDDRLISYTDSEGRVTAYAYDAVGNRIAITDPTGHTVTEVYDKNNQLLATIDPSGNAALSRTTTFQYDIIGNATQRTDAEGRQTVYTWDAHRQMIDVTSASVLDGSENLVAYHQTYAYDGESNIVTRTDDNGHTVQDLYNVNGLVKRETDAVGNVTEYTYDGDLNRLTIIVGAQLAQGFRKLVYSFDTEDELVTEKDALGNTTSYSYDAAGNIIAVTDGNSHTTNFEFDRDNRLVKETRAGVTDPVTNQLTRYTITHQYDANGNEVSTTDERGHTTTVAFDKVNRRVLLTDGNGIKTVFVYDAKDNITKVAIGVSAHLDASSHVVIDDASHGKVTTYVYDEFNQLLSTTDGVGNALVTSDDAVYQKMRQDLGKHQHAADLTAVEKSALLALFTEHYTYDRVGNRTSYTDHLGRVTTSQYDALDRLQSITEATGTALERTTAYRYDGNGNLVKTTDAMGRVETRAYDAEDRLTDTTNALGTTTKDAYDTFGNRISETLAYGTADARTGTWVYDLDNRVTQETDPQNHTRSYEYDAVGNRVKITDGRGGVSQMFYDALDRLVKVIDPLTFQTNYEYDGADNRITIIDAKGGIRRLTYDAGDRYVQTTDAEGRITKYAYDNLGNTVSVTTAFQQPEAQTTTYAYDAEGNLRQVTDAAGNISASAFDAAYNLTKSTDGNGHTTTYAFDALNRQITVTDALGGVSSFTYDAANNILTETDAAGRIRSFAYDDLNRTTVETDALGVQTAYAYDRVDNRISITRAANTALAATTTFEYNKNNQLTKLTNSLGHTQTYTYDSNDNIVSATDENSHVTTYAYDADDQLTAITDALGGTTHFAYDGNGNRVQVTDARGGVTTTYYNGDGEVVLTVDATGAASANAYDHNGNVVQRTDYMTRLTLPVNPAVAPTPVASAGDRVTHYAYDALDRLVQVTDALGGTLATTYDAVGNRLSTTDQDNHTTTYTYDADDRLASVTDALGGVRSYSYDAVGNKVSETDQNGHTTTYTYDLENRVLTEHDPLGGTLSYVYDARGNRTSSTDERGHTTTYTYDALDHLLTETDPLGGTQSFAYDNAGNKTSITDQNGHTTTIVYDAVNRIVSQTDALSHTQSFVYDAVGNRTGETDQNGHTAAFQFDLDGRITHMTDALGATETFTYDAAGNRLTVTDENGHTTSFAYDANNRLVSQTDALGALRTYAYDAAGNKTAETDENGHTVSYAYDANNELIGKLTAEGYLTTYGYDAAGNQTAIHAYRNHYALGGGGAFPTPAGGDTPRTTQFTYDADDRMASRTDAAGVLTNFEYDAAGNQTAEVEGVGTTAPRTRETHYDNANRVVETVDALGTVTHLVLDGVGNVIEQDVAYGTASVRSTTFTYDAADRLTGMTDALGFVTHYTYDAAGQMLSRTGAVGLAEQRVESFTYDAVGNLTSQVNGAGETTTFAYDAAGNRTTITVAPGNAAQRVNSFEYDADNRMSAEVDGVGTRTEYHYDAVGNETDVVQAAGLGAQERHTLLAYSADDRLLSVVTPVGYARAHSDQTEFQSWRTAHGYAQTAATLSASDIQAILNTQRTSYQYDDLGNRTQITEADGTVTANTFDVLGRLLTNTIGTGGLHGGVRVTNTYDEFGNVLTSTRGFANSTDQRTTTYTYDKLDRQTSVTDGEGFKTVLDYDAFGNTTRVQRGIYSGGDSAKTAAATNPLDTHFTYDALDRLVSTTDGDGNVVQSTYDALGDRLTQTTGVATGTDTEHESTLTFIYDQAGRLIEKDTATGGVVKITYDAAGNQVQIKTLQSGANDNSGVWMTQTYAYDDNGRVTLSTSALGIKTAHTYDAVGNEITTVLAQTTSDQRTLSFTYDLDNNNVTKTDALGNVTTLAYDAVGNLVTQTDALGHVTRFYYDAFHRVVGQVDPLKYVITMTRDSAGNITGTTIFMNAATGAINDGDPLPVPTSSSFDRVITSTFDLSNRLTRQDSPDGSYKTYEYDSVNRLVRQRQYGAPGLMSQTETAMQAARVMTWVYDAGGRLETFTNVDGTTENYVYDAANNKVSETVANTTKLPGNLDDPVRTTTFAYDLDNRLVTQVFDPDSGAHTGLKLQQQLSYDKAGNVVSKTDARNTVTTTAYDLDNRVTSITDPLSHVISYQYDSVGNLTQVTDPNGHVTTTTYDLNDRVTAVTRKNVAVTHFDGTTATVDLTTSTTYDDVGNAVQITDARGFETTRWYDADNQVIAERSGDSNAALSGAVRAYTYDATGSVLTVTQDMQFHTEAIDFTTAPSLSNTVHTVTNTYDIAGRVTRTQFSQIDVTTLSGTSGSSPTSAKTTVTPQELNYYDAFGNLVESVDRNGNHSYAYYDAKGRQVASVDAGKYLTETVYDDQDHVVQQRKYATKVAGTISVQTRPAAPDNAPYVVDRLYDAAGRMTDETSPPVQTAAGSVRVKTHFTYDANGNLTSKIRGYSTISGGVETAGASPQAEYSWYDAANRRVAVVGPDRILNQFTYDALGNCTAQKRFYNAVPAGTDLASATLASVLASVTADATKDEETDFTYDAANHLITRTDLMGAGAADDIVNLSGYDETGNLTYRRDADNFVSRSLYDGAGHVIETQSPNGSLSFIQYDTGGLKVRAWTGGDPNGNAPAATIVGATVANGANAPLVITWNQPGSSVTSWVAWDTVAHAISDTAPSTAPGTPGVYANATGAKGSGNGLSANITLSGATTIYFRIMSKDAAGNLTWTEEKSVVVPPRIHSMSIAQSGANFVATVTFDSAISGAATLVGPNGSTAMTTSDNTTFTVTFSGTTSDLFHITWVNGGITYTTDNVTLLAASGAHVDDGNGLVSWPLPNDGTAAVGNGQYLFVNGVLQSDSEIMGSINGTVVSTNSSYRVNGVTLQFDPNLSSNGTVEYDVVYGTVSSQTHSASIDFTQRQYETYAFNKYNTHQDSSSPPKTIVDSTVYDITWHDDTLTTNLSVTLDPLETARVGAGNMLVAYRSTANGLGGFSAGQAMSKSSNTYSLALTALTPGSSYDVKIYYIDHGKEVIVEWRRVTVPANAALPSPSTFQVTVAGKDVPPTLSADNNLTRGTNTYTGDNSIIVLATEAGGSIQKTGINLSVTAGTYTGPINPAASSLTLTLSATANNTGGTLHTDGLLSQTYYTEIEYNALGVKIATNEDNGLWRRLGVDANGNVVETDVYGTKADETANHTPIVTFSSYDERNLKTGDWGASVGAAGRGVTRYTYDYNSRAVSKIAAGNDAAHTMTFVYDGVGNMTSQTDAEGHITTFSYDIFGHMVSQTDANSHVHNWVYGVTGLLTEEYITGITNHRYYGYDNFGRRTSEQNGTVADHSTTSYAYDQHDRITTITDALSHATNITYDKRDHQIWVQDANGHFFGRAYDGMGQVTNEYSFVQHWTDSGGAHTGTAPTTLADAISAVASSASTLINKISVYDLFGNKISEDDGAGHHLYYSYGAFGRLTSMSTDSLDVTAAVASLLNAAGVRTNAVVNTYTYDRFGRKTGETSDAGKAITYAYDDANDITQINDTGTNTKTTYTYDVAGRRLTEKLEKSSPLAIWHDITYTYNHNGWMLSWKDASTSSGIGETYTYDAVGNVASIAGFKSGQVAAYFTHTFSYDAADRATSAAGDTYTYDSHGRRASWTHSATTVNYTYDANDRVTQAGSVKWTYDKVGNVTSVQDGSIVFSTDAAGNVSGVTSGRAESTHYTYNLYDTNNASYFSESSKGSSDHPGGYTQSTTNLDKSQRTMSTAILDASDPGSTKSYTYSYLYNSDGLEASVSVSGSGSASGSATDTYNADRQLIKVDQGKGDGLDRNETKTFTYDNSGHIVKAIHDPGKDPTTTTYYLYAGDNPAGEYTDATSPVLDQGNYTVLQNVAGTWADDAPDFPSTSFTEHVVAAGETLQSIASQLYGHPELWYVIADANGLTGSEALSAGARLAVPNSVQYAGQTYQTHALYKESSIVGSKLPNISTPPPSSDKCALIAAIILIVVVAIIAVIVTVVTVGAAAPAAAAALGVTATSVTGIIIGVAVGAVIGAVVGFTASVITQGILIGFGLQDSFDWKQVAADTVAGAFSGAAGGLGALVEAAESASVALKVVNVVGQASLEVAGEVSRQAIADGHVDNWTGIALAGAGGAFGALAGQGVRSERAGEKAAAETVQLADVEQIASKGKLLKSTDLQVGDTVFKNSKFKFKVVEDAENPGQKIIKRFERVSALRNGEGKLLERTDTTLSRGERFKSVFKQGLLDQTQGIRTSFRSFKNTVSEFFETGTVTKFENTKVVRTGFITKVDEATGATSRAAQYKTVLRESVAGTSITARLKQFAETWSSVKVDARTKIVKTVEEATNESGQVTRKIKETTVVRDSWTKKLNKVDETLIKYDKTKVVRGYREVKLADGTYKLESGIKQVYRERFLRTSYTDRIKDFFGLETGTVGKRFLNIGTNESKTTKYKTIREVVQRTLDNGQVQNRIEQRVVERLHQARQSYRAIIADAIESAAKSAYKSAGEAVKSGLASAAKSVKQGAVDLKNFLKTDKGIGTVLSLATIATSQRQNIGFAINHFDEFFGPNYNALIAEYSTENPSSTYYSPYHFNIGGATSLLNMVAPLLKSISHTAEKAPSAANQAALGPFVVHGHPERDAGKDGFDNRSAASTFDGLHEKQNSWMPTSWAEVAASVTTQIYSPFGIDRAADLATTLAANQMVSGQVGGFDAHSIVGFAVGTLGHGTTNPIPNPIAFLDSSHPNPGG